MADELFDIEPLDAAFGAVVTGVELRSVDDTTFDALHKTWLEFALLIFPSLRPLVKVHPETGRPNLLIGRHAYGILGEDTLMVG